MESAPNTPTFKPVGNYDWPARPTQETVRRLVANLWLTFRSKGETDPFISDASLRGAQRTQLQQTSEAPVCAPLVAELQATFADWIDNKEPSHWLQLVVLPPCDENSLVRTWAQANNHVILEPPSRESILTPGAGFELPELRGDSVVVVPRLEHWFLRHHNGLREVRTLLNQLTQLERHCLVGCNSWAWRMLASATGADAVFPCGLMFQAFDAERLRSWFSEWLNQSGGNHTTYRWTQTGEDLFAVDGESGTSREFFTQLAARSLGIPWVAWHMWMRTLRLGPEQAEDAEPLFADEDTLWIATLEDYEMPMQDIGSALLVLHALLIHDSLTASELELVVPNLSGANVLSSLVSAGFILREAEHYRCSPAAYPAVRTRLNDAGFPMDQL